MRKKYKEMTREEQFQEDIRVTRKNCRQTICRAVAAIIISLIRVIVAFSTAIQQLK